jgi:tRNA threonylcarbamoyladenosine biosynthesis protein TsaB
MVTVRPWILGVETSTPQGSLALVHRDQPHVFFETIWSPPENHSDVILLKLNALLKSADLTLDQVGALVCGHGPGSFTGIRVALNFAKSLAYAHQLPVYLVDTLRGLAEEVKAPQKTVLSACEAFRDLIYIAQYHFDKSLGVKVLLFPEARTCDSLLSLVKSSDRLVGSGSYGIATQFPQEVLNLVRSTPLSPRALAMIYASLSDPCLNSPLDWKSANPLYIRASEAEEKLKTGALKPFNSHT